MEKHLTIFKASPIVKSDEIARAVIIIGEEMPDFDNLAVSEKYHEMDASELAEILITTLPGGTLSRLTAKLLENYAGYLRVPANA